MRIVQVSTLYPPDLFSGGTLACHQIAASLRDRGHEVSVFAGSCLHGEAALAERSWKFGGIPVHAVNVTSGYAQGFSNYRNVSVAERFDRYLAAVQPDVVHFHSIQALGADTLTVARGRGAAAVVTMHDGWFVCPRQFMFVERPGPRLCPWQVDAAGCDCIPGFDFVTRRRFLDGALEHVDRVLAVSAPFADLLRKNGVAPSKIVTCENGLAPPTPLPRVPSDRLRFGHVGVPDGWKGLATIASAMRTLERDIVLELHGLSPEDWQRAGGRWPDPRLRLRPRFRPPELPGIMAELDVVLVTSVGMESFSIVTREALQYGLPVIASRCLGPEAAIRDGENGLVVERGDARALADAMRRLADEPALLARTRAGAAATPVRTIEQQVAQIEGIYGEIAPRRERSPNPPLPRSVLFIAGMEGAPFRYRVGHLLDQLESLGVKATARFHHDEEALQLAGEHEIVVLNRVAWDPYVERIVARARAAGALLVFAVDDLIFDPTLEITALKGLSKSIAKAYRHGIHLVQRTFGACDAFLGSTPALADAARRLGKPAFVHPNTLSAELVALSERAAAAVSNERTLRPDRPLRIGYFSGSYAHDCDFAVAAGAIERVLRERPGVHLVIGGHLRVPDALAPFVDRIERLPFVSWRELPALLARIDINLAPLETPSPFNDAKSVLKWFEAAVAGVPTIASPTSPFREAIRHGENGFLAATPDEWAASLAALVDDAGLRVRVAGAARTDALALHGPEFGRASAERTFRALQQLSRGALRSVPRITAATLDAIRAGGVGIGRAAMEPREAVAGPAQVATGALTPRLSRAIVARQPLFFPDGTLFRIDVFVGTYGRLHAYDLVLSLVDLATGEELARSAVPGEHACDNAWLAFELGDVPTRAGRQLAFVLEAPEAPRRRGMSLYCEASGWPAGVGSCGAVQGIQLTYRTWMRLASERGAAEAGVGASAEVDRASAPAARAEALERRLAIAEARLARAKGAPNVLERVARRSRAWRTAERLWELIDEPGPSLPNRAVRKTLTLLRPGDDDAVEQMMERVRTTLAYRLGRSVYRRLTRR